MRSKTQFMDWSKETSGSGSLKSQERKGRRVLLERGEGGRG